MPGALSPAAAEVEEASQHPQVTGRQCSGKESACWFRRCRRLRLDPWVGTISWSRNHSSILAWNSPWTEEPGRLPSMGLQSQTRMSNGACVHTHTQSHICKHNQQEIPGFQNQPLYAYAGPQNSSAWRVGMGASGVVL